MRNKTIVITGVSSGVGKRVSEEFTSLGYRVIGLTRDTTKAPKNIESIECDISNEESVIEAFKQIDGLDILVNNASTFVSKNFRDLTHSDINDVINTNLKGTIICTLEAVKKMKKGRIINIGSVSGTHGIPNQTIYSGSKFGVMGFSDALGQELKNINITTICPGGINTPLWSKDNKYDGNVDDLLTTDDIVSTIKYITNLNQNVVVKEIIMFPKCEWH